ncbi:TadE/TadG family type IV pilus assembly protein [uncultured Eubacterium sp.]|uniref:TadE/TadG family type IV pilus assembly protein n=1 Tax=uncultured Eubacterium sp. TaxID=165185 RepID=UPI0025F3337A|nr:TadE family protein [uncultured Eubacterium sp.]
MRKEEKGAVVIVEASFVFPIMFFVLLFLLYMGNMFYMRSQVDALTTQYTIAAAAECADPLLEKIETDGAVPRTIDSVQPYHSLSSGDSAVKHARSELDKKIKELGTGFFAGMNVRQYQISMNVKKGLINTTIKTDVSYQIKFPLRFLGDNNPVVLKIHSACVAPVTDTPEFIQNVDMAKDFADSSGLTKKLNKMVSSVKEFLGKGGGK